MTMQRISAALDGEDTATDEAVSESLFFKINLANLEITNAHLLSVLLLCRGACIDVRLRDLDREVFEQELARAHGDPPVALLEGGEGARCERSDWGGRCADRLQTVRSDQSTRKCGEQTAESVARRGSTHTVGRSPLEHLFQRGTTEKLGHWPNVHNHLQRRS